MIELKEFIKETLLQVAEGVANARQGAEEFNCSVAPTKIKITSNGGYIVDSKGEHRHYSLVEFEVDLILDETKSNSKGIGVAFGNLSFGGANKNSSANVSTTRVKFTVPISYSSP